MAGRTSTANRNTGSARGPRLLPIGDITGLVLAGGRGARMGGVDKGLVVLKGLPLIEHVAMRLRPQVGTILISANRNIERYAALGFPVVPDLLPGFLGPLAGIASGLHAATTTWVATVPCDSPMIAPDLVARLAAALLQDEADIAVAHDGERVQPVFLLLRRDLVADLVRFLETGGRKTDLWIARHRVAHADFRDVPEAFVNVNRAEDRARLEAQLAEIEP